MRIRIRRLFVLAGLGLFAINCQQYATKPVTGIRAPFRSIANPAIVIVNAQPAVTGQDVEFQVRVEQLNAYLKNHRDAHSKELKEKYSARINFKTYQGQLTRIRGDSFDSNFSIKKEGLLSGGVSFNRHAIKQLARGADVVMIPFYYFRQHAGDYVVSVESYGNYTRTVYCPDVKWVTMQMYMVAFASDGSTLYTDFQEDLIGYYAGLKKRILLHEVKTLGKLCAMRPIVSPDFKHALPDYSVSLPLE